MSKLRAKPPEDVTPRLKMLLFGAAGVGKTTAALNFERSYVIDAEKGTQHYADQIRKAGSAVFETTDVDEVVAEVKALITEKHDYRTVIIDPITTIWNELLDKCERKVGSEFGRHQTEAGKILKRLINLLTMPLDCNVIMTAHGKNEYGDGMQKLGTTFDGFKKLDFVFDLVLELEKDRKTKKRTARVVKTRLKGFPDGDVFPWSYEEFSKRHGVAVLEREAVPVALSTPEQVKELKELLNVVRLPEDLPAKWLAKAKVEAWEDMPADAMAACIQYVKDRLPGRGAASNGQHKPEPVFVPDPTQKDLADRFA